MKERQASRSWRRSLLGLALGGLASAGLCGCGGSTGADASSTTAAITVAAASDLRLAFEELGSRFTDATGTAVTFSFGSSGQLQAQILNGAPFDVFASADGELVDALIEAGEGVAGSRADYALGRIALWSRPGTALPASVTELADPRFERIAVANPEHAPYGRAAIEALEGAGIRDDVRDRLVYGESVSDALRIAESGNADVGIVALSLVVTTGTDHLLVPDDLHEPLRQALVVTAPAERLDAATEFARYVNSNSGREIMLRYGFALPGEHLPPR